MARIPSEKRRLEPGASAASVFESRAQSEHISLPHNPEMERAVIAGILTDPVHCVPAAVDMLGDDSPFFSPGYAAVYKAVMQLFSEDRLDAIDVLTVADMLQKANKLEAVGGEIGLAEIQNSIATVANFDAWLNVVRENAILRRMIQVCSESAQRCSTLTDHRSQPMSVEQTLDMVEGDVLRVRAENQHQNLLPFAQLAEMTYAQIQKVFKGEVERGMPTGYPDLDFKIQGGVKPGEMFVLAARPSIGKTAFALNVAAKMLQRGKRVAFFSLEMTAEQLTRRMLCTEANVSEMDIYKETPKLQSLNAKLTNAMSSLQKWPLYIDPTPGLRVMELKAKVRRMQKDYGIDIVFVDYLQLMRGSANLESRQQEVAEISSGLKSLAKEMNIPVFALAQLSRETEKNATSASRPKLSHLRESGAIEQDADIVAFLHRDRDKQKTVGEDRTKGLDAELIVEKNRNGEIGIVNMLFFPWFTQFKSVVKHAHSVED